MGFMNECAEESGREDFRQIILDKIDKLETINIEYCPHGYGQYINKDDVIDIIKNVYR